MQYIDEVSLGILEGFKEFRMKREDCDVITAHHNSIIVKSLFKWASKPARGFLAANPALDWETPVPVKPKRPTPMADANAASPVRVTVSADCLSRLAGIARMLTYADIPSCFLTACTAPVSISPPCIGSID